MENVFKMMLWNEEDNKSNDEFKPYIDVYLLEDDGKNHPVMVIFPGGAYEMRADYEGVDIAKKFNTLGFNAVVVQYRVAPNLYPAPQLDAFRAIKLVRANADKWHINKDEVVCCGFSAGGHLAASTGTLYDTVEANANDSADCESQKPNALVLCYPVISFCKEFGHVYSGEKLLGDDYEKLSPEFSLEKRVTANTPPTFLWHTANDQIVPVRNSFEFANALKENNVMFGMNIFPDGNHGLGLAEDKLDVSVWPGLVANFLKLIL